MREQRSAVIHVSWVDPLKIRKVSVVGTKQMLVYDDLDPLSKIQIYDKGVDNPPHYDTFGEFLCSYKYGDIHMPRLKEAEPLSVMCKHFLECIETGATPRSDGESGLRMVRLLAASDASLAAGGTEIQVYPRRRGFQTPNATGFTLGDRVCRSSYSRIGGGR